LRLRSSSAMRGGSVMGLASGGGIAASVFQAPK
jgi:hypothetical protein